MRYAITADGWRQEASSGAKGVCPICILGVIGKAGPIVVPHWAHVRSDDCDPWWEPITTWHTGWQNLVPAAQREVIIGRHRADLVTSQGFVIEVQRSSLSGGDIRQREDHYGSKMAWIFDCRDAYESGRLDLRSAPKTGASDYVTFRWKQARKSLMLCRRRVFLDLGEDIVLLGRIFAARAPVGGYGWRRDRQQLINFIQGV